MSEHVNGDEYPAVVVDVQLSMQQLFGFSGKQSPVAEQLVPCKNLFWMQFWSAPQQASAETSEQNPALALLRQQFAPYENGKNNNENAKRTMISALPLFIIYTPVFY